MGEAAGRMQAQQQANISAAAGVGPGMGGNPYGYGPYAGYGNFNQFLFAIGYLLLGAFAIAFGVTYFVPMSQALILTFASVFGFFLFHHMFYVVARLTEGYITTSGGFAIFFTAAATGVGFGALWTYYLLDEIKDKEHADIGVGAFMGVICLFLLISWSARGYNGLGFAWNSTMYAQGPGLYAQGPGPIQSPMPGQITARVSPM